MQTAIGKFKAIIFNVKCLTSPIKKGKILKKKLFIQQEPDSTYLQETHLNQIEHRKLKRGWMSEGIHPHLIKKRKKALAILMNETACIFPLCSFQRKSVD